jgi:hypothetical protein
MNRDLTPADRALAASIAEAHPLEAESQPKLQPYLVQIKSGKSVVMEFAAMGPDSMTVAEQHHCLCAPGQYVKATASARSCVEPLIALAENELAEAEVRQERERVEADIARNHRKAERWHESNDARALAAQVLDMDAMRRAGW